MKKVVYSITKVGRTENTKITGVGYVTDELGFTQTLFRFNFSLPYFAIQNKGLTQKARFGYLQKIR